MMAQQARARAGATVTHMGLRPDNEVGVRDLRQNLSRFLTQVKAGKSFVVTERGREVARLTPSGPADSPIARLVAERGATMPQADLLALASASSRGPAGGPPSEQVLAEMREERL
jgi:prevent-host-death family protein